MQIKTPKVSVIIPTFNRKKLIQPSLESVIKQTYRNYEIIIVDDASTDGTAEWLAEHYPKIHLVCLSKNRGAAGARNEGIRKASGSLIAFLDSDDQWLPNYLERQVEMLNENPSVVLSFTNFLQVDQSSGEQRNITQRYQLQPDYIDAIHFQLLNSWIFTMSTVLIRRNSLIEAGLLNERLKISHDRELYLRLLLLGDWTHISEPLAVRLVNHSSNVSSNVKRSYREAMIVLKLFYSNPKSHLYHQFESEAKWQWSKRFAKRIWQVDHDIVLTAKLLMLSCLFSPRLTVDKIRKKTIKTSRFLF